MIRNINLYEKDLILKALASLEAEEKKTLYNHIKSLKSLETSEETSEEAIKEAKALILEAEEEAKASVFEEALKKAEASFIYKAMIKEAETEKTNFLNIAEEKAEEVAEAIELNNNTNYYYTSSEALAQIIYSEFLEKAEEVAEASFIETEEEAYYLSSAISEASYLDLINFIHKHKLEVITELKASSELKAFIYVSNNINIIAEEVIKEAKNKAKKEALFKIKASEEVKTFIISAEAFNNVEPYNKSIISNYINFNHMKPFKNMIYNVFDNKYSFNSLLSFNITTFDNTFYIIIANNKVLSKLEKLASEVKAETSKDKYLLRSIKKAEEEAIKKAEEEAELIEALNFYKLLLDLKTLEEAEEEAELITSIKKNIDYLKNLEAIEEAKTFLEASNINNNYFKSIELLEASNFTIKEALNYIAEASALSNQYKAKTSLNDFYPTKEVFKNKKSVNKVNSLYGLVTSEAYKFKNIKEVIKSKKEANNSNIKIKAKASAKYNYIYELEASAIFRSFKEVTNYNLYLEKNKEAEEKAEVIQRLNFLIGLNYYNLSLFEAITFKKAIDL